MSKPKKNKTHVSGGPKEQQAAAGLRDLRETIMHLEADPEAGRLWGDAQHALMKTRADRKEIMRLIASRDIGRLKQMLEALESGRTQPPPPPGASPDAPPGADAGDGAGSESEPPVDPGELRRAMQAFRRRLKLQRLDDESRLTVKPMTSGRHSEIAAIIPPREFADAIWRELARRGDLVDMGQGFYRLAEEPREKGR